MTDEVRQPLFDDDDPPAPAESEAPPPASTRTATSSHRTRRVRGRAAAHDSPSPSSSAASSGWRGAVRRVREVLASALITVTVLAAAALALGAGLIALRANQENPIVSTVLALAHRLDGPFADIFTFEGESAKQALVNWGIAAIVYLITGRVLERVLRP